MHFEPNEREKSHNKKEKRKEGMEYQKAIQECNCGAKYYLNDSLAQDICDFCGKELPKP